MWSFEDRPCKQPFYTVECLTCGRECDLSVASGSHRKVTSTLSPPVRDGCAPTTQPCLAKGRNLYLLELQALTPKQTEVMRVAGNQTEGQRQLKINQASWKKSFAETVVSTA